jgi:glycosyltransferase involved in cell wall biosynthesis
VKIVTAIHFLRRPGPRAFSIERLFADVRAALPADIACAVQVSPYESRGVLPRLRNILAARRARGPVNHITGDVHFLALGLPKRRTILTVHDCGNLHRLKGWRRAVLKWFWFTWPMRHVCVVTTVSETTKQELVALTGVAPGKVRVVLNCVSPEFTRPTAEFTRPMAEFAPRSAPFNAPRPRILMLGTAPNKNLERMAAALAGLPCVVELVGTPRPEQARAFAQHGVELVQLGSLTNEQIVAAYERCDLVLFASTHEGFGLPIVEGQAVGRPVVTSNCSSMAEVAGDSACLVDPLDVASIRAGVVRVCGDADYRAELVRRGFENVKRFSARAVAEQYAALYREIAAAGDSR